MMGGYSRSWAILAYESAGLADGKLPRIPDRSRRGSRGSARKRKDTERSEAKVEPFLAILAISRSRYSPSGPCCCYCSDREPPLVSSPLRLVRPVEAMRRRWAHFPRIDAGFFPSENLNICDRTFSDLSTVRVRWRDQLFDPGEEQKIWKMAFSRRGKTSATRPRMASKRLQIAVSSIMPPRDSDSPETGNPPPPPKLVRTFHSRFTCFAASPLK